jgi:hypothetical protein
MTSVYWTLYVNLTSKEITAKNNKAFVYETELVGFNWSLLWLIWFVNHN